MGPLLTHTTPVISHRPGFRLDNLVDNLADLLRDGRHLALDRCASLVRLGFCLVPTFAENFREETQQFRARRQLRQHRLESSFNRVALHGLPKTVATTMTANTVWVAAIAPLGQIRSHGLIAVATCNKASQRVIDMDFRTRRSREARRGGKRGV